MTVNSEQCFMFLNNFKEFWWSGGAIALTAIGVGEGSPYAIAR